MNDAGRQFQEEQDTCLSITNSMKKLVGDKKRFEEMVENMENKWVELKVPSQLKILSIYYLDELK